jgi:hypothetical protein
MKKVFALMMSAALAISVFSPVMASETEKESVMEAGSPDVKGEGVMTYAEYMAAEVDDEVTIEAYVQGKQAFYDNKDAGTQTATIYTQDHDGAYFLYNCAVSKEDYDRLEVGTKIKAVGYKSEWSGEIEIVDGSLEIEEGSYVVEPLDLTEFLDDEDSLKEHMNAFVSFKGMTVEKADDSGAAFLYNYDGSGSRGDDLYFNVSKDGKTYSFTVESYLCDKDSDVYKAVEELQVGDVVDLEGFLYWYEGPNPHITSVTVEEN